MEETTAQGIWEALENINITLKEIRDQMQGDARQRQEQEEKLALGLEDIRFEMSLGRSG